MAVTLSVGLEPDQWSFNQLFNGLVDWLILYL